MPAPGQTLDHILANTPCLWKGRQISQAQAALPTGHAPLDNRLPGGGWPRGAVTELITAQPGLGEFSLLFPALAAAGQAGRWLLLVDPPWIPYPATLYGHGLCLERLLLVRTTDRRESLWACEQALSGLSEGIVLAWPSEIRFAALRRLQLVAEQGGATAFLFRPEAAAQAASPAALRLKLGHQAEGMRIDILKCRGHVSAEPVLLRQPRCIRRVAHKRSSITNAIANPITPLGAQAAVAGDPLAAPGPGLSYQGPARAPRPHRHH